MENISKTYSQHRSSVTVLNIKHNFELTAYAIFEKNPYFSWTNIIGNRMLQSDCCGC